MPPPVPKKFRYTLFYGDQANEIQNAPDGWSKTTVKYNRSETYGGVLRMLTLPYTFVREAATLLRRSYYQQGTPLTRFWVDKLNPKTWDYKRIFTGKIDFSTKKDTKNGFEASVIEDNFNAKLDAYEDVKFAIPLEGADVFDLTLTPLILREKADFIYYPSQDYRSDAFFVLNVVNNTQLATQASVQNSGFEQISNPDFSQVIQWFYIARASGNVTIKGHIEGLVRSNNAQDFSIEFYKSTGEMIKQVFFISMGNIDVRPFSTDFDFSVNVTEGERLFCYFRNVTSSTDDDNGFRISEGELHLTYNTQSPASTCKAILAKDLFKRIVAEMDDDTVTQSNMLAGEFGRLAYTCSNAILTTQIGNIYEAGQDLQIGGTYVVIAAPVTYVNASKVTTVYNVGETFKAIPGYDTFSSPDGGFVRLVITQQQILISFKDFFQDMFGLKCGQVAVGMDGGKLCLEDLIYFYRAGLETVNLGKSISDFEAAPNLRRQYTAIRVGYEDKQYNALNGVQEVMSTQNYITPYQDKKNELNAICVSRADPFGVEEIRAITPNVDGNTAASRSDNDTWMFMLHPTENRVYTVAEGCMSYAGVDGSYYNWQITPKQNLLRGGRFLTSCLDRLNGLVSFKSGEKNVAAVTVDLSGRRVAESENVAIANLGARIFRPELFTFNCAQDKASGEKLMTRPYGEVRFNFEGIALKGFINDVAVDEAQNSSQKFTVECCGDVDLMKLIR
jgi:hypothetical protein